MERFLKYLETQDLIRLDSASHEVVTLDDESTNFIHFVTDAPDAKISVTSKDHASALVVLRSKIGGNLNISIDDGAHLNMVDIVCDENDLSSVVIKQHKGASLNSTILQLASSNLEYIVDLDGAGADNEINILQLPSKEESINVSLRIAHNSADCTSRSTSKCAASGSSTGEFHGLVYVAEGAQRTFSEQNSRNVALSPDAKIIAEPQLEIYADDVKCSHGATVGQMNKEAILYMRQRGLSEELARKLQLDGFVAEVTNSCAIEQLRDALSDFARKHLLSI